jgi:hypothetical protein
MKKREIYKVAQQAVADAQFLSADVKIEVLRLLFAQEDTAKWLEEQQEKNNEAV